MLTICLLAQIRDGALGLVEAGAVFLHAREGVEARSLIQLPVGIGERVFLKDSIEGPIADRVAEGEVVVDALGFVVGERLWG